MSRLSQLTPRDLETLSAYLDGALSAEERLALERRLAQDVGLREALDGLRTTRALLRAVPQVRPPRNFTLTAEMAGVRRGWLRTPFLQLATAVATLAFVVTVGVDVLGQAAPVGMLRAAAPAPEMLMEAPAEMSEADALSGVAVASAPEEQEAPGEGTPGMGAVEAGEACAVDKTAVEETPAAEATVSVEGYAVTPTAALPPEGSASLEAPNLGGAGAAPPAPATAPTAAPMLETTAASTLAPADQAARESVPQTSEPPALAPEGPVGAPAGLPPMRWLEIGLGLVALVLGLITLRARGRGR